MSAPKTVVLVSIDTWRRDATGFLGGLDPSPTPFLDRIAARGVIAADAISPVPMTSPTHWSMLSGRWPWRDGMRVNGDSVDRSEGIANLPEVLRKHDWRTGAFISAVVLDRRFGFDAGFENFDDRFPGSSGKFVDLGIAERRGDATVDAALSWLAGQGPEEKLFLWIHLFDPHFPYLAPEAPFPGEHGAYLAEVAFVDRQIERLEAELTRMGRPLEESLWVVLSDHGEAFGAHNEDTHGLLLHGATTSIPLFISGSSVEAGRLEFPVSTVDVLPTVLGHLGLEVPENDGVDLLRGTPAEGRSIPLESMMGARSFGLAPAIGLRNRNWFWEASPADHLWDRLADPNEEVDLATTRSDTVAELRTQRDGFGVPDLEEPELLDQAMAEQLQALGYFSPTNRAGTADVRTFAQEGLEWFHALKTNIRNRNFSEAEIYVKKFTERYPDSFDLWQDAGYVAVGLGDPVEAEVRFRRALSLHPDSPHARLNLANVLVMQNRMEDAEVEYRRMLELDPNELFALHNLGDLFLKQGRVDEAVPLFRSFLEVAPAHPQAPAVRQLLENIQSKSPR